MWWKSVPGKGPQETLSMRARVDPRAIGLLNSLVDAYEGIACLRTLDAKTGEVEFWIAPDLQQDFREMLSGLQEITEIKLESGEEEDG